MTRTELDQFRATLTARIGEMELSFITVTPITVEGSADQLEEIQAALQRALAVCNLDRDFNQLRNARAASVVSNKATLQPGKGAIKAFIRSGLRRCRGLHFAYSAGKPETAILKRFKRQAVTCSLEPREGSRGKRRGSYISMAWTRERRKFKQMKESGMAAQTIWLREVPAVNYRVSIEIDNAALAKIGLDSDEHYASGLPRIVGNSAALRRVLGIVGVVAPTDATVLINGETTDQGIEKHQFKFG